MLGRRNAAFEERIWLLEIEENDMRIATWMLGFVLGCSGTIDGGTATFPQSAYSTTQTMGGDYAIALRSAPSQPPTRGEMELLLSVTNTATSQTVDGLELTVDPWMPAMGHGSSMTPIVTPRGGGDYLVTNVVLAMPGTWQINVTGVGSCMTTIPLEVE